MIRRLILKTYGSNEYGNEDYEYAYFVITKEHVQEVLHAMNIAEKTAASMKNLNHLALTNYYLTYFKDPDFEKLYGYGWNVTLEDYDEALEPESFTPVEYEGQRTEGDAMCVTSNTVWWASVPKHGNETISTTVVNKKRLLGLYKTVFKTPYTPGKTPRRKRR